MVDAFIRLKLIVVEACSINWPVLGSIETVPESPMFLIQYVRARFDDVGGSVMLHPKTLEHPVSASHAPLERKPEHEAVPEHDPPEPEHVPRSYDPVQSPLS